MAAHENETNEAGVLGRLVDAIPKQYREEAARLTNRIRDTLPPVVVSHRIDELERAIETRLDNIDRKLDEILRRLEKHSS